nr:branched-chain amino acid transport system II carrier protein [Neobacillus massiliamazoniensis]
MTRRVAYDGTLIETRKIRDYARPFYWDGLFIFQIKGESLVKKKDIFFVGLMLFSMFFGAGNLIFPPFLGMGAGTSFWPAIIGFIITAVGLPLVVLTAIALINDSANALGNRVHPWFGTIFTVAIYLSIGPFFGIPRNANVAFEMGFKSFVGNVPSHHSALLLGFTAVFFFIAYLFSLNPSKMVSYSGRFITPTLLLSIGVLCVIGFLNLDKPIKAPDVNYHTAALFKGLLDGYSTMDALGSLAFGIVIITTIQQKGVNDQKQLTKFTIKAGLVAGAALTLVYIAIGYLGAKMSAYGTFDNGTAVLSNAATILFGNGGKMLLGAIFTLACFTACVGITISCGVFFSKIFPKLSYRLVVTIIMLASFFIANLGLNQIIAFSVPILDMAYPLTIVLVTLSFLHRFFGGSQKVYAGAMLLTGIVSLFDGLKMFGLDWAFLDSITEKLPLASVGFDWIVPAVIGGLAGFILEKFGKPSTPKEIKMEKIS